MATRRGRLQRRSVPVIRNRRGEEAVRVSATDAKNNLGELLDRVGRGGLVLISKHESPRAVLLSMDEYEALSSATETKLAALDEEFDALLDRIQTAKARAAMRAAFSASPKQLGKAALAAARKRG